MSEPPSLRMKQIDDELNERLLPCPKGDLFQRLGRSLLSVSFTSRAGSQDPPRSHNGPSVVPSTMPGTFPGSDQPQQDTADGKPGQLKRRRGRWEPRERSGDYQSGNDVGRPFYESESDDDLADDDLADDCSPPWLDNSKSWHLSPDNAAAFCRQYHACLREDGTSYSRTAGTVPNATQSNH
jgi:hypothetical protein